MDSGSTIHGIPQWEHPKQIGCEEKVIDAAPPFSPRRPGKLTSQQLLPPRTPTTVSTTSQSQQPAADQPKRSPPNTSMDHRALLKMDGISPDKMLIAFDSDSRSCCPSVGDITWDQSEAMAFQQSSMEKLSLKAQQQQHPWENFTELQPSPRLPSRDRPPSTTTSRPNRPDPPASPRKSKNQLATYGKTHVSNEAPKRQPAKKSSTDRTSRSRTPTRSDKESQQPTTVPAAMKSPTKMPTEKLPIRKKNDRNEIDLSFNFGSGSALEKCPEEVNLAALFRRKKERSRKANVSKKPHPMAVVAPVPPTSSRPESRTRANPRSANTTPPPEQFWPGSHAPSEVDSDATRNLPMKQRSVQDIHVASFDPRNDTLADATKPTMSDLCVSSDVVRTAPTKRSGTAEVNRLHFDDAGMTGKSWKKLNCSKSSLHSSSKHIEESIQSLETTLFGTSTRNVISMLVDANEAAAIRDVQRYPGAENDDDDDEDDYDVVNEIVDDYIDFDTAIAMTSAIMED